MPRPIAASLFACALLGAAFAVPSVSAAEPMSRTWSDASGRFKIKATFVSLENNVVTLRQENGKEVEIPLRKLNPADQAFAKLAAEAGESPFKEKGEESPFMPKEGTEEAEADEDATDSADAPLKTGPVAVDWNDAEAVDPQPENSNWSGAVKPEQVAGAAASLKTKTIRLPKVADIFEKARDVVFSPNGEKALVGYVHGPPGKPASTRLVLLDMKTGKALGSGAIEGEFVPLGLTDDGKRVFVRTAKFGFGENGTLEVWSLGKSGIIRGPQWAPYEYVEYTPHRDVHWGTVLADGRALSINGSGRLALWDLDEVKAVWYLDLPQAQIPAVSADGKYLAYETDGAIGLLDVAAGKVLALLPAEKMSLASLAFSPDGRFLAGAGHDTLWVWDVAAGSLHREINTRQVAGGRPVAWAGPDYVALGDMQGPVLVHVESRIPAWQYTDANLSQTAGGVTWFHLSDFRTGEALVGAELPHAAAEAAVAQAMSDPNFFILKPGSAVALDLSGIPDADRPKVGEDLRKKITDAGFTIAGSAPVTVKATVGRGESREIRYRSFGSFNEETHKVQEYLLSIAFVSNGVNVWEAKGTHFPAPFFANLKEGQTIAQLLRESDKPSYDFFNSVRMPKFVPRPSERAVLGTSPVAAHGVR